MRGIRAIMVVAAAASLLQGCLGFVNMDLEKASKKVAEQPVVESPRVRIIVSARVDGSYEWQGSSLQQESEKLLEVLQELRPEYEFLADACMPTETATMTNDREVELTLNVSVTAQEKVWGSPYLSGYSFMLIPFSVSTHREFEAELLDPCGEQIASHLAGMSNRVIYQLHLLWLAPVNLHLLANPHPTVKAIRNLLDRVEQDLAVWTSSEACSTDFGRGGEEIAVS